MRWIGAGAVLATAALGSCVNIPAFRGDAGSPGDGSDGGPTPCGLGTTDVDCDGWPTDGSAFDCDDNDPDKHPGRVDLLVADLSSPDCQDDVAIPLASATVLGSSVVTGPYTMQFAPSGVRLPSSMRTRDGSNTELMNLGSGCEIDEERAAGYSAYPALAANVGSTAGTTTDLWNAEATGRAMARVRVSLRSQPPCPSAAAPTIAVQSDFTFFPDGRLVRHDALTPDQPISAASCAKTCAGTDPNFFFTSYFAFADAAFDRYQVEGGTWQTAVTGVDIGGSPAQWHCFGSSTQSHRVGTTWFGSDTAASARFRRPSFVASVLDLVRGATIESRTYHARSALFLYTAATGEEPCDVRMPVLADTYRVRANLGGNLMDDNTGIYVITADSDGQVSVTSRRVEIKSVVLPPGTAFDIPIASDVGVSVWFRGDRLQANSDYQVQPGEPGRYVLWLPFALAATDVLTILGPGATL